VTADVSLVTIAVECPVRDCDSILRSRNLEHVVYEHLVERHGCIDTVAHVMAFEVSVSTAD
jgi:hypothetical protein